MEHVPQTFDTPPQEEIIESSPSGGRTAARLIDVRGWCDTAGPLGPAPDTGVTV